MAKQVELNKQKGKGTGQGENRPVWNNVQRLNHQNKFVPKAVLTKTGIFSVNTARQNPFSQAAETSTARKVNTARPIVNEIRQRNNFYKSHSPIRRPFNKSTAPKAKFTNNKVNTAGDKTVSAVRGYRETAVKASAEQYATNGMVASDLLEMCDKKYKVLFTDTECLVLSSDFKLPDENQVLLRIPRQNNMYSFNLENIVPSGGLACLIAKATIDESNKWHRRLGHVNFKNLNKLVKGNLVRGLPSKRPVDKDDQAFLEELERLKRQEKEVNDAVEAFKKEFAQDTEDLLLQAGAARATNDSQIHAFEDIYDNPSNGIFTNASYDDEGAVADFTNLESTVNVSPIPTSRIHSIHPTTQILRDPKSAVQTRSKVHKSSRAHAFVSYIQKQRRNNHKDFQHCLFACFLSQIEPKKISEALEDESWVDAMQEELLQFKIQKVWILIDLPYGKKAIGTKWVYRNKQDERGFVDPKYPKKAYKVVKALYGLHQAPRAWYATLSTFLLKSGYRRGTIDKTLFIKKDKNDIIVEILKKFDFASVKTASTPIETHKSLTKDEEAADVDVHLYRSMIGSLMYLTASRPDIIESFGYLKGKPKLGLWYPKVSSFDLEAYSDSDYAGANLYKKSIIGGCQFLGRRLISWQCKKQTIVATSTTEAEYVLKIHTDDNVADLLTKAFDVSRRWVVDDMMNFEVHMLHEDKVNTILNLRRGNCWKHGCSLSVGFYHHTTNGHQFTMSNRHQELASPEQTASGKDFLNPLIVDSLLKTIWFINAPCFCNETLAIPGKTTTGKELSNPLMAGSLPKTTLLPKLLE
ncbi:putative ribonuclease H-like domain-containing protein [Tanacetum coccineum]